MKFTSFQDRFSESLPIDRLIHKCQLQSERAASILREALIGAPTQELSATEELSIIARSLAHLRGTIARRIQQGQDTQGAIADGTPDRNDVSEHGRVLQRSPREKAGDELLKLDFQGSSALERLLKVQQFRALLVDIKSYAGESASAAAALNSVDNALKKIMPPIEAAAYRDVGQAMGALNQGYKEYLKKYGEEISGETRDLLEDVARIAAVGASIANDQNKKRGQGI